MYGHSVRCTDDLCLDLLYAAEVELLLSQGFSDGHNEATMKKKNNDNIIVDILTNCCIKIMFA